MPFSAKNLFPEKYIRKTVFEVQRLFFLILQSPGDYTVAISAAMLYVLLTCSLCIFSWFGNELSTHVCKNGHHFNTCLH
jgi:hypothetical protein